MEPALFERSVRLALALESVAKEHRFDAFTAFDQVWLTDPRVGIIPSYGTGRLCEIGIPASPEGDVNTAVAQLIMQELAGQATTLENYVIDFENEAVMFSHDGHGNPALGTPGAVKVKHSIYYSGVHGFGAGFEFAYEPGPITNLALVLVGDGQLAVRHLRGRAPAVPAATHLRAPDAVPARHAPDRRLVRRLAAGRRDPPHGRGPGPLDGPAPPPRPHAGHRSGRRLRTGWRQRRLRAPVFEIGLKGYLYGADAVRLARAADRLSRSSTSAIIFDPQAVDIPAVALATERLLVFAQHMDPVAVGRGVGSVLPEALREAGAVGTLLNHSERRMTLGDIDRTIQRARDVGLATLVCADSPEEAAAVAQLGPDIVLAEPPELIATSRSAATEMRGFVERSVEMVRQIDPGIIVMCGAGVQTPDDVEKMIGLGVDGTGSSSGILKAADPVALMRAMLTAMKRSWDELHARPPAIQNSRGTTG